MIWRAAAVVMAILGTACGSSGESTSTADDVSEASNEVESSSSEPSEEEGEGRGHPPAEPLTERQPGCLAIVAGLPDPEPVSFSADPLQAAFDGTIAPLPLPGHEDREIIRQTIVQSVDEFFEAYPSIIAPEERRQVMEQAGLVVNIDTQFAYGEDVYGVQLIRFASAEGAQTYFDVHVRRICRDAINLRPLDSPAGGVIYSRIVDGFALPRAVALMGDTEISVTICRCVGADDLEALAGDWMGAIVGQLRTDGRV